MPSEEEDAVVKTERRLWTLIDAMTDFVCFLDIDGRWLELNRYGCELLQVERADVQGKTLAELLEHRPLLAEILGVEDADDALATARECALLLEAGTRIVLEVVQLPVFGEAGQREGTLVLGRDQTAQRSALEELQEQKALYRSIMEDSPLAIYLHQEGQVLKANESGLHMAGTTSYEDLLGRSILDFMHPDFIQAMRENAHLTGRREYEEEWIYQDDGRPIPVSVIVSPVHFQGKQAMHIFLKSRTEIKQVEHALSESEAKYQMIAENTSDLIALLDPVGTVYYASPSHEIVLGYSMEELLGHSTEKIVHPDDQEHVREKFKSCLETQQLTVIEFRCITRTGEIAIFEAKCSPIHDDDGEVYRIMIVSRDITERKRAERELEENEQLYKSLFEHNLNAVISMDLDGRISMFNQTAEMMTGYSKEEVLGKPFSMFTPEERYQNAWRLFHQVRQGTPHFGDSRWLTKQGDELVIDVAMMPIRVNNEIIGVYGMIKDITEQKRAEALVSHMAYYDSLTDLPNRTLFRERLQRALRNRPEQGLIAILFVDLDHFKHVNDTMGHAAGDHLLKMVAERLQDCLPEAEAFSRISGDEFVLFMEGVPDAAVAEQAAVRVLDAIHTPFLLDGQWIYLTGSIGIVLAPFHGEDPETLLQHADIAMYDAKDKGKNKYRFFDYILTERMAKRVELERAMRAGLAREEFVLFYQPLIEASSGRVVGAEGLIRWHRPGHGLVSPAEFIPIAEETGLIVDIGDLVLRSACLHQQEWRKQGYDPIHISVNLSTRQFQEPTFLDRVYRIAAETEVDLRWIGFEITESLIMQDVDYAIKILHELRNLGSLISIDDFGTGYSSLAYLKTFPIDKLKIDRTFVRDITTRAEDEAITKTIITLAKSLHLKVVAEGVETAEQIQKLRQLQCDEFQGFYFSKPVPVQEFLELIAHQYK